MSIDRFLRPIKVGLKSRWFMCLTTVVTGYLLYLPVNPYLKLFSVLGFVIGTQLTITFWGNFFLGNFLQSFAQRKHVSWDDLAMSEALKKLATEQGITLHKRRPLGIRRDFDNAFALPWTRQIIVGDALLKRLSSSELLALFGHELTHLKQNHGTKLMWYALYMPMVVTWPLTLLGAPHVVSYVVTFAAFCIIFSMVSRRNERLADEGASVIAGPEAVISLLKHIVPQNRWRGESETHPSILRRIVRLRKRSRRFYGIG